MTTERPHYLAYMLRLWEVASDEELAWRASLESPHTGERRGFASLEVLFEFLEEQTGRQIDPHILPPGPAALPVPQ
jgi:hypothetical protein